MIFSPDGVNIKDVTLENYKTGKIKPDDCRTSKSNLLYQAEIARQAGNSHIAENFERAAELVDIDGDRVLEIYNALRPFRSTEEELKSIVFELRERYHARLNAKFIAEAITVLKSRRLLKGSKRPGGSDGSAGRR